MKKKQNKRFEPSIMNLYTKLLQRENSPVRVCIIGAGKFATMFLSQIIRTPGMQLAAVCDLDMEKAKKNLFTAGFSLEEIHTNSSEKTKDGQVFLSSDVSLALEREHIDVVIESTGDPIVGARHALLCIDLRIDIIMVNVEADVLVGPVLARKARENNVLYSLAYGDQPALIVEQVDTVRSMGLEVVCAGKGTKYLPSYHQSTPETVWDYYGLTKEQAERGGMNSKMFNSFLDGTKSAIEMTAVSNATGLKPPEDGLSFPPCSIDELASILKPKLMGGTLQEKGMVEVISSLNRNGSEISHDLRWGVFVVFEAGTKYVKRCFQEYGLVTDKSGNYSALYRPYHLIGLELGVSVASVALRREATGAPLFFNADVISVAKRDLRVGEVLDGEGGSTVWGKIVPAKKSISLGGVPIGLATGIRLIEPVPRGSYVTWNAVKVDNFDDIFLLRKQMENELLADC